MRISDFFGDHSYLNAESQRQEGSVPIKCAFEQLLEALYLYGVIPLCSKIVHEIAPHTKGILIGGASGTGKKMVVHAIANEINATLIDLSCENLVGKYQGKKPTEKFLQMVFRVAKAYEPSIIILRDAEIGFMKKPPKKDSRDPKRLKKALPKIVKTMNPGDQVLLIGVSDQPSDADPKLCSPIFQKFLTMPEMTYGTRRLIWRNYSEKLNNVVLQDEQLCSLAKITEGWSSASIKSVCEDFALKGKKKINAVDYLVAITDKKQLSDDVSFDLAS